MVINKNINNLDKKPFFIAEIGINHGGSLKKAKLLIDDAVEAGADAVKFQTYISELRAPKNNKNIFDILKTCELNYEDFKVLKDYSEYKGIIFFSTPFDIESVDFLSSIGVSIGKIASFDTTNTDLISHAASKFNSLIFSTGMTSLLQINECLKLIVKNKCEPIILHCISSYPLDAKDARLSNINYLKENYGEYKIGYSDHSNGIKIPLYAISLGANIIEKHFMLENDDCIDRPVSISKIKFKEMVTEANLLIEIMGNQEFGVRDAERSALTFRRY